MKKVLVKVGSYSALVKNDPVLIQAVRADFQRMHEEDRHRAKACRGRERRRGRWV